MRENSGQRSPYKIRVEAHSDTTSDKDLELILNKAQIDSNSILRAILTFEDTYNKQHFLVFQDNFSEDRLYMINEYPDFIIEEH